MNLTLRQKQLLELLSINCRFSNRDIAKTLRCSEDAVDYQIKKLIEEEKLARFSIQFDYFMLGYRQYHLWLRLNTLEIPHKKLEAMPAIISVNDNYGKYDVQLIALVKQPEELQESIASLKEIFDITEIGVAECTSHLKPFTNLIPPIITNAKIPKNKKNPLNQLTSRSYASQRKIAPITLDAIDKKIIAALLKNPRIKFSNLSEQTGINHETIRYRINGYVKNKLILNFGLLHDFQKYGLYTTYILLNVKTFDKEFLDHLQKEPNVFYAAGLTGSYSGIIYLVSHNPEELGVKLKGIRKALGNNLLSFDLIQMEKIYKYLQFPEKELK